MADPQALETLRSPRLRYVRLYRGKKSSVERGEERKAGKAWSDDIEHWFTSEGDIGLQLEACTPPLVVIDADMLCETKPAAPDASGTITFGEQSEVTSGPANWRQWLSDNDFAVPNTFAASSPGRSDGTHLPGGEHWIFTQNPKCLLKTTSLCKAVQILATTICRLTREDTIIQDAPFLELPLDIAKAIRAQPPPAAAAGAASLNGASSYALGGLNNYMFKMYKDGIDAGIFTSEDEARRALTGFNAGLDYPMDEERLLETALRSGQWHDPLIGESEVGWARRQTGITEDDPDDKFLDIQTVKRLVTAERYRKQQKINEAVAKLETLQIMTGEEAADVEPKPWLIGEIIPEGPGTGAIIGPRASFKTTIMLLMASAIIRGDYFLGKQAEQGSVVFVAGEASEDTRRMLPRIPGHEKLIYTEGSFPLLPETAPAFTDLIDAYLDGSPAPSLIIMDALSRFHAGDEDKAAEMLEVWKGADIIAKHFGAFVILIGHTGHSGEHIRGTSAWGQALHTEIYTDGAALKFRKQRGIHELSDIYFTLDYNGHKISITEGVNLALSSVKAAKAPKIIITPSSSAQYAKACEALLLIDGCSATEARMAISTTLHVSRSEASEIFMNMIAQGYLVQEKGEKGDGHGRPSNKIWVTNRN